MTVKAIDLFAGLGGLSVGAKMSGLQIVWAGNHWRVACDTYAANHPGLLPKCQDLHQADWSQVPPHDMILAAPCCQGHSRARGKAANDPQHDASRSTAWAVVSATEFHRPEVVLVENVPEFTDWILYPAWCAAMQALGYQIAPHIVDAADFGVPQNRVRLFLVCTRSKAPLMLHLLPQQHATAATFVDFTAGKWTLIGKPGRAAATHRRVANGRAAHGPRFVMPYYGGGSGLTGRSLNRPIGTITTRDRWAVVDGERMRMLTKEECRSAMGFPDDYKLPEDHRTAIHLLGNAVCPPVACELIRAIKEAA